MHVKMYAQLLKKQKENSHEGITWSEMAKQNVQAKKVYCRHAGRFRATLECCFQMMECRGLFPNC